MNRAYSLIEVKDFDDDRRVFSGWATTPVVDRVRDRINPLKASFAPEIRLLHQHNHERPIGNVRFGKPTSKGIPFEAEIPVIHEPPTLKERVDVAYGEIKHGLVKAVSIGFSMTEDPKPNEKGGWDFEGIEIYELSTVTIPANAEALITQIKSVQGDDGVLRALKAVDAEVRRENGITDEEIPAPPKDATVRSVVVKLDTPARDRAFVINKIHPAKPAGS